MHPDVAGAVDRYLAGIDTVAPGLVGAFYVVGSTALGAFVPRRSDIDFVAVATREPGAAELDAIRRWRRREYLASLPPVLRLDWPLVCNGLYVRAGDLATNPLEITPLFSHVSRTFNLGRAFDANPAIWQVLATAGIAVRGPDTEAIDVWTDRDVLTDWVIGNLNSYWRSWAGAVRRPLSGRSAWAAVREHGAAWGVPGVARMHYTVTTGEIISKVGSCDYALDTFDARWHPIIEEARAFWQGHGRALAPRPGSRRPTADFVDMVIEDANRMAGALQEDAGGA